MDTDKLQAKLQKAYHSMLDDVEDLVIKEHKSLKEAISSAANKLDEWEELTKEEVESISDQLFDNLSKLGEQANEVSESLSEMWQLDKAYLSNSIWGSLMSVADKTRTELLDLNDDLYRQSKHFFEKAHGEAHEDHQHWHSDHKMWMSDIARWRKEYKTALEQLDAISNAIYKHAADLEEHQRVIEAHESESHIHEKVIAQAEQEGDDASPQLEMNDAHMQQQHEEQVKEHKFQADLHVMLNRRHRESIALIKKLHDKLCDT